MTVRCKDKVTLCCCYVMPWGQYQVALVLWSPITDGFVVRLCDTHNQIAHQIVSGKYSVFLPSESGLNEELWCLLQYDSHWPTSHTWSIYQSTNKCSPSVRRRMRMSQRGCRYNRPPYWVGVLVWHVLRLYSETQVPSITVYNTHWASLGRMLSCFTRTSQPTQLTLGL